MKTVYKYPIELGIFELSLPKGSKIVHADEQSQQYFMWVEVTKETALFEPRRFVVAGTGMVIQDSYQHISTWLDRDSHLVWHLYEVIEA